MDVPSAVRELALHPFRELPPAPGFERIERGGFLLIVSPFPSAQIVEPMGVSPEAVMTSVATARAIARERGKTLLAWWLGPDRRDLEQPLEAAGLAHQDTPGFEAVENAMVLLGPPEGQVSGVVVRETSTYEEFAAANRVVMEAFDFPDAMRSRGCGRVADAMEEKPILASHGFRDVGQAHLYVDTIAG